MEQKLEQSNVTKRVTWVGAIINTLLAIGKTILGFVAQSQSLIADGIHSFSDLLSDFMVLVAAHHAHNGPDSEHPYGHGRFETVATLGLGVLLAIVGVFIGWDAGKRLFFPEKLLQPTTLAIYVALASIVSKEWLYHYTMWAARKTHSRMLKANAWHHRSDAVSSVVVMVGVIGTQWGLPYLDAIAAIVVGVMIVHVGWEISWPALKELVDAGLEQEQVARITEIILSIGGVKAVHMLRTRMIGGEASVDVHVLLSKPWLSVSEGHVIGQTVIDRLRDEVEEVFDVTVHIDPEDDEAAPPTKGLPLRAEAVRWIAEAWREIPEWQGKQRLILHYLDGKIDIDLYLPLESYRDQETTAVLTRRLQEALDVLGCFGRVRCYYGTNAQY